jgi:serine/threonine protein kinase
MMCLAVNTDAINHSHQPPTAPTTCHGQHADSTITCRAQVELLGNDNLQELKERLVAEIRVLKQVKHRNIITFHDWWFDPRSQCVNFITEYFTSGTLRQFRKRAKHISEQAVKRWAWQVVEGLVYLHGHQPPVIHRCADPRACPSWHGHH